MCSQKILIRVHLGLVICLFLALRLVVATNRTADYEIRTLTGEPNYKSVDLTWEVEAIKSNNTEDNIEFPKTFTIFYCELQNFGPHRCRSKTTDQNSIESKESSEKQYSATIDNLRMATKYSFHIKPLQKKKSQKITGRSDNRDNEVEPDSMLNGQTIVIPTKGFSAQATKCLPHASEIEVETGPYFGGKIVVDGGNCGIKGNPKDSNDKYVMRIDHAKCGSVVKPESNTVETFITVQENLGIFTHSTRRFVVVCTFQSGMQTVRASFTVPGKGGASIVTEEEVESGRSGRERQFRMVDKSALVLKEPSDDLQRDSPNSVSTVEDVIPDEEKAITNSILSDNLIVEEEAANISKQAKYAMLVDGSYEVDEIAEPNAKSDSSYTGVVIAASLSLIMVGILVFVLQREIRRLKTSGLPKRQIMTNA